MFVVPDGSWTRVQKRCRNLPFAFSSTYTPKSFRSLLFGGIEPDTTVGTAVSSLLPWPNELSSVPLGWSVSRSSATLAQSMDGDPCSTVRFASVSISKWLPSSETSPWLARTTLPARIVIAATAATSTSHRDLARGLDVEKVMVPPYQYGH